MGSSAASRFSAWWQAFRYNFTTASLFPAVLGATVSWAVDHTLFAFYLLLVLVGVQVNHLALNMADEYFDFKHGVDKAKSEEANPYAGGSGALTSGKVKPSAMFKAFLLGFAVTLVIGLYLTVARGFPVLLFGLFGGFCSVFYTAPPISFGHHSLGELAQLVSFGTIIGLGSFYVQTQRISLQAFVATLPLGIMLFSMIVINEIPDYKEDRAAGKLTLVARFGRKVGVKLYYVSWVCTYGVILAGVLFRIVPITALLALLSLPLTIKSMQTLQLNYEDPVRMAPANLNMIRAHSVTAIGLIAGYVINGLISGASLFQLTFLLCAFAVLYIPAGLSLIRRPQH